MLAFSIWNALWVVFVVFIAVNVLMMLFAVIIDLFRDHELSGWAKAGWALLLLLAPVIGLLIYVIARGSGMAQRAAMAQRDLEDSLDARGPDIAGGGAASELGTAAALHDAGKLTDAEFTTLKQRILN